MSKNRFLIEVFRAFAIGTLIFLCFLGYDYFTDRVLFQNRVADIWKEYYVNLVYSTILYMVNMSWFYFLLKKWDNYLYTYKRMAIAIMGNLILSVIGVFIARFTVLTVFFDWSFQRVLDSQSVDSYQQSVVIALGVALIFYAIYYYKYRQETKVTEQKIIASTASAKFDALKSQLDPHFLFNSLNVLTSLIEENPYQAQKFTTSLSKVYRYVLEQKNKDLVTVDEELQFARTYVRLLKMRFEDSIVVDIPEQCSDPEAKIVPLSLQLLLENAVKHNVVSESRPLHLTVHEEGSMLVVSNNLQEKQVVKKSSGVGLRNIKQRYAILTDKEVNIVKTDGDFKVFLPMLTKTISKTATQEIYLEGKRYEKAKEKVENIKGFYGNLISYCCVIPFLVFLNYRTTDFPWVLFPIFFWGWGLVSHGMQAFGYNPLWGKRWEERKMRKYMNDENF